MTGATFTTDGTEIGYTAEEYDRISRVAWDAGHRGVAYLLRNLRDSAYNRPNWHEPYHVIVHPETARIVFACGG